MDHFDSLARKVALLRSSGAVEALAERWSDDDDEADEEPEGLWDGDHLVLADPVEPVRAWPGGLGDWYRLAGEARFGIVSVCAEAKVRPFRAVDAYGEPMDDGEWLRIGRVESEDVLLMDAASGEVAVYFASYFKYGWDSPVVVRRPGVAAFLDEVATGAAYRQVRGPVARQRDAWWDADRWWRYMVETGMVETGMAEAGPETAAPPD